MLIERLLDENNKLEIRVVNDDDAKYTNLKAFKKDFLPLLGEHRVVRVTEHTFSFQVPELYDTTKVLILFHSDLCLYNINMLRIFEYNFPRFENLNEK
jgi:hypothetical protein